MNQLERAWAAGLFDGEGSFYCFHARNGNYYPQVSVGQAHREVLDRFQEAVGVGKVYGPYQPGSRLGTKIWWQYHAHGFDKVTHVLDVLRPYLSSVKVAQGEQAITKYLENTDRRRTMTDTQRDELFRLLSSGVRGSVIARELGLSTKLVSYHKRKLETKLLDSGVEDIETTERDENVTETLPEEGVAE